MMNKKGVSEIITTIIIVGIVLVAIGIVYAVIMPIIRGGTQNIDYSERCIEIDLRPTSLSCTPIEASPNYACTANLQRNAGTGNAEFDGVVAVFSEGTNTKTITKATGNIEVMKTGEFVTTVADGVNFGATKVKIAVYFDKTEGGEYICPGTTEYTNA